MSWDNVTIAAISAGAALLGTLGAGYFNYGMKRMEARTTLMKEKIAAREKLYCSFVSECSRLITKGLNTVLNYEDYNQLNTLLSEIRLTSTDAVQQEARDYYKKMVDFAVTKTAPGPLGGFIGATRKELDSMRAQLDRMNE